MMNNSLLIEHLHVDGFWGKYTIDISFNHDVNILTGVNGVGKTTILDILYSLLTLEPSKDAVRKKYVNATLLLANNSSVSIKKIDDSTDEIHYVLYGKEVSFDEFDTEREFVAVSTFDSPISPLNVIKQQLEQNPDLHSDLDLKVNKWIAAYNQYGLALVNRIMREKIAPSDLDSYYEPMRKMESLCEEIYGSSKHWTITNEGKILFKLEGEEKFIGPESLSSGEKQMLILILSTFIQWKKYCITFWDEPEVSLHIGWQQLLIRVMRDLNPHMQLIIATHSPNILYEGWERRVINVKNVIKHE